jgi:primosomal protein N'
MLDIEQLKQIALANVASPTSEYYYRMICRWYSKTFHTPLHVVFTLPIQDIFLAYFEEGYEMMDEEKKFEEMIRVIDPDFDAKEEEAIQEFISMIEEQEENKRRAKEEKEKIKKLAQEGKLENQAPLNTESSNPNQQPQPPKEVVRVYNEDIPDDPDLTNDDGGFSGGLDDL